MGKKSLDSSPRCSFRSRPIHTPSKRQETETREKSGVESTEERRLTHSLQTTTGPGQRVPGGSRAAQSDASLFTNARRVRWDLFFNFLGAAENRVRSSMKQRPTISADRFIESFAIKRHFINFTLGRAVFAPQDFINLMYCLILQGALK